MTVMDDVRFDEKGLIPVIVQEAGSGQVLMLAYMNEEALTRTIESGQAWYYSRSRKSLWRKGEQSGNGQQVVSLAYDCDGDALLLTVNQTGPACHTGHHSCFYRLADGSEITTPEEKTDEVYGAKAGPGIIYELLEVIRERKREMPEGSYTAYLFAKGTDKICKKVGEEAAEVIIAAKNRSVEELTYEMADLVYHLMVLGVEAGLEPGDIFAELKSRR